MPSGIHEVNVKFSENRAVRGFRWDVLLNAFYINAFIFFVFSFFPLMQLLLLLFCSCHFCF
jgi:hypothetical protein